MKAKTQTKKKKCEIGSHRACNNVGVIRMWGDAVDAPSGYVCMGCAADLRRSGIKLRTSPKTAKSGRKSAAK